MTREKPTVLTSLIKCMTGRPEEVLSSTLKHQEGSEHTGVLRILFKYRKGCSLAERTREFYASQEGRAYGCQLASKNAGCQLN